MLHSGSRTSRTEVSTTPHRGSDKCSPLLVTPRRWLDQCNPGLSQLISETLKVPKAVFLKDLFKLEVRALSAHGFSLATDHHILSRAC